MGGGAQSQVLFGMKDATLQLDPFTLFLQLIKLKVSVDLLDLKLTHSGHILFQSASEHLTAPSKHLLFNRERVRGWG